MADRVAMQRREVGMDAVDTLFVVVCALLVFFMNAGFALLETGLCRAKNAASVLAKNFAVYGIACLAYWAVGYALMFGPAEGQLGLLVGSSGFAPDGAGPSPSALPQGAFFFFQLAFAATAASIVSGAVAERTKYLSYLAFCLVCCGVIYPIVGHWIWGGGWLAGLGFTDFAGSTVVHVTGGVAALVGAWMVGPRAGRFDEHGRPRALPGHDLSLATLGTFVLWLGWFGFNAGSALALDATALRVVLTTALASAAGVVSSTAVAWLRLGKPDLTMTLNGCLGALVAITAGCAMVTPAAAVLVGAAGGAVAVLAVALWDKLLIDDPVGALAVHLTNGILGTLAVGLLAHPALRLDAEGRQLAFGLLYGGGAGLLGIQLVGVAAVALFVGLCSLALFGGIKATLGLRVPLDEERVGLDVAEIGVSAYPEPTNPKPSVPRRRPVRIAPPALGASEPRAGEA